jgi:hypothetical protein
MARSYRIKPDQLEAVHIYVNTRGGSIRVLHDLDLYRRVVGTSSDEVPLFCFNHEDYPDGLPEGMFKETAYFAPVTFAIGEEISNKSIKYEDNPKNPSEPLVRVDLALRTSLRIKHLLRKWSLSDEDETLLLTTYNRPDGRVQLTNESIAMINNEVDPKIIRGFMEAYEFHVRASVEEIENEAVDAIKEGSGGKIEVKN